MCLEVIFSNNQSIKLNEELDRCFQQNMSLQRQVEQYQLKEKTAEMIESSASFDKMIITIAEAVNRKKIKVQQSSTNHYTET
jgi:hypothetical protein